MCVNLKRSRGDMRREVGEMCEGKNGQCLKASRKDEENRIDV